jgi:hypothetical protein
VSLQLLFYVGYFSRFIATLCNQRDQYNFKGTFQLAHLSLPSLLVMVCSSLIGGGVTPNHSARHDRPL